MPTRNTFDKELGEAMKSFMSLITHYNGDIKIGTPKWNHWEHRPWLKAWKLNEEKQQFNMKIYDSSIATIHSKVVQFSFSLSGIITICWHEHDINLFGKKVERIETIEQIGKSHQL